MHPHTKSTSPRSGAAGRSAFGALAALSLAMLLASLSTSIANVALPTVAADFAAPFLHVQWVVLAYLLAVTTLVVTVGRLGDGLGRRRVLVAGLAVFVAGSALCGLAPSLWLLVAARAVQGAGAAVMMALAVASIGDTVPKARTGSAMGLLGTISAVGTALGPALGGWLIGVFGWPIVFFVTIPPGLLALLLTRLCLPAAPPPEAGDRPPFDIAGAAVLALTLIAFALAASGGGGLDVGVVPLFLLAAVGVGVFVVVERRAKAPLVRLAALREATFSAGLTMNALVAAVMMATLVVGPFFLVRSLGLAPGLVGMVMSVGPAISAVSGIPAGRLVDRFGAVAMTPVGLALVACGSLGLAVVPSIIGVAGYVGAMMLLTPGYQLFLAANTTAVMVGVPAGQRGVVSGMLTLSRNLGLISGASLLGAVFALAAGGGDAAAHGGEVVAAGMQVTFAVATGLIVVALVVNRLGRGGRAVPAEKP